MKSQRWSQIGKLFNAASNMPAALRREWLHNACGDDERMRADLEHLLAHDRQADEDGFLYQPEIANSASLATGVWPPANGRTRVAARDIPRHPPMATRDAGAGFSPKAAITSDRWQRSAEETRSFIQSRLRELPLIYILIFGMIVLLRPVVLHSLPMAILAPFAVLATTFAAIAILLSVRSFSLASLQRIELVMTLALVGLVVVYEGRAIIGPLLAEDRIRAEKVMKNVVLLVSLVMLIDAIYVPKGWGRAAIMSSLLAALPMATIVGAYLLYPDLVRWVGEPRTDGNKPLAVFGIDLVFLLTLAIISSFAAQTISRLRSQVVEARRFGQYRLGEQIGAGGMGEVFLAEHELLKRPCAVKLIRPEVVQRAGAIDRFEREVRINATLSHPNTVEIFDYGRTEDGTYYYVMEYLPGMSLGDLIERYGPLPPGRAVYLLRQVALALAEAHEAGLIHRDIKPSNVFAARRGGMDDVAKLLDFGLVRPVATASSPRTSDEWQILGTPLYMSPEQATSSRPLDGRSDIYSLGAVAYYLLTGRPPFDAETTIEAIIAHARDPVVPPSQIRDDVPADLDAVILRCLSKDPTERFPDAESLEIALGLCTCASSWDKARARQWWNEFAASTSPASATRL
jgi:tRNA A-37 threonylcarbamoyl transferase component Bud32